MYLRRMESSHSEEKVAVIGLGKLGLPLALAINSGGFAVLGFDLNPSRVAQLQNREYSGPEPRVHEMLLNSDDSLAFSTEVDSIRECTIAYIIVPTPSDPSGVFSSNYVEDAIVQIKNCWANSDLHKVIVIVSTVMPGTTDRLRQKYFTENSGIHIDLIYSPEFIALGSVIENLYRPDSILIGSDSEYATKKHLRISEKYLHQSPEVQVLNPLEAELAKILVNTYVTMKISFANFIGEISTNVQGINAYEVARAIGSDSRIGTKYLMPGLGFGGPCFPRDNKALIAYAKSIGLTADLATSTDLINDRQPEFFINRIRNVITSKKKIGILGLSYKQNSEVIEASQGVILANQLQKLGFEIICFDNYVLERPSNLNVEIRFTKHIHDLMDCELLLELIDSEQNIIVKNWQIPILKP